MTLPLILRPEAVHDLIVAHEWYEEQKVTLGADFLAQASAIFDRIRAFPEMYGIIWQDVRSCSLRRFPYVVYYRVLAERIEVLAVLHGSLNPVLWQTRTSDN